MVSGGFHVEQLERHHDRAGFSCGVPVLDQYLRTQAGQDQRRNVAAYVLIDSSTGGVAGYYTLSAFTIAPPSLSPEIAQRLPRYPTLPGILVGRLAVDLRYRGQHLGEFLLLDALRRALELSGQLGAMAVVVQAKDGDARSFYERYGFIRFLDHEYSLYLPMGMIVRLGV